MVSLTTATTSRITRRIHVTDSRSTWLRLDWAVVSTSAALLAIGSVLVWSATASNDALTGGDSTSYVTKHVINVVIGIGLAFLVAVTDYRWVRIWAPLVYLAGLVGLGLVLSPIGTTINGSRSWIMVGGMSMQPAEFAKLGVVAGIALLLAEKVDHKRHQRALKHSEVLAALVIAAMPATLILAQPDLGTMLVLSAIVFGLIGVAGAPKRWLFGLAAVAVGGAVAAVKVGVLEGYQLLRFQAFMDPTLDPRGAGYNTTQARIAIGNGGLYGQGLFDGTQTQSGFVPEQHTDFIFTVAGEELGLLGAGAIIALYLVLLWRAIRIGLRADDMFGRLAAAGVVCWFGFQAFQNIGMCLGIMPVTGVPLPLMSYGGTSMFASMMAVGLLLNIHLRSERSLGLSAALRGRSGRSGRSGRRL